MRFTRPDTGGYAHVVIDGGFRDDGEALVEHVKEYYVPPARSILA
jgi:hypothetical protein